MTVYLNPYALPVAFMAGSGIQDQSMDATNPFELQNQIYASLAGSDPLFRQIPVLETRLENVTERRESDLTVYAKTDPGRRGTVEFIFQVGGRRPVYAFFPSASLNEARMYVNGEDRGSYFTMNEYDVVGLGSFGEGDVISFKFELQEESVRFGEAWFYDLDMERFASVCRELERGGVRLEGWSDARIAGTVEAATDKTVLFTSIPWDRGWQALVDGRRVETVLLLDALMGVELTPGTHRVEFMYRVPGLAAGLAVSGVSLGLLAALTVNGVRRRRRQMRRERAAA
jgi:uncharacterized membrane protein YfhO